MAETPQDKDRKDDDGPRRAVLDELNRRDDGRSPTDANTDEQLNDADETPQATLHEAARAHSDSYLVKTDMEDADERSVPGAREQP